MRESPNGSAPAMPSTKTHQPNPILTFYLLAFAISWTGYLPLLLISHHVLSYSRPWLAVLILPAIGPALAAWLATPLSDELNALRRLRASFTRSQSPPWWLTAAFLPPILLSLANLLSPSNIPAPHPYPLALANISLVSIFANPCEEIGWRGFALTRLQQEINPLLAALTVGVLWSAWHIPLFLLPGSGMHATYFWSWSVGCVAGSVFVAWLYNRTRQSLAIVTLFHISFNIFGAIIGTRSQTTLTAVKVVAAVVVLSTSGPRLAAPKLAP